MPPDLEALDAFFRRDCQVLARDIVGKTVRFGNVTFVIKGADAFPENVKAHAPVALMSSGDVYVSPFMNQHPLLLIACLTGDKIGGSVRITEIEIQPSAKGGRAERISGAGKVGKVLGLKMRDEGMMTIDPEGALTLAIGPRRSRAA
jgi:3-methyladenine DNA glycosylase Mpg